MADMEIYKESEGRLVRYKDTDWEREKRQPLLGTWTQREKNEIKLIK